MYVPFNELPESSKIWIYQSDREFSNEDLDYLNAELKEFTKEWVAHSQTLKTSYSILFDHFIILSVDESVNDASGCSVDSSVRIIKKVGEHLSIDFFKRENLAFLVNEKVELVALSELKTNISEEYIKPQSEFFNNQINSKATLDADWKVEANSTWLSRYFK